MQPDGRAAPGRRHAVAAVDLDALLREIRQRHGSFHHHDLVARTLRFVGHGSKLNR